MEHPERDFPFKDLGKDPIPKPGSTIDAIISGKIRAPEQLEELKDFRTKLVVNQRDLTIVGMRHRNEKEHLMRQKRPGHTVLLVPEPSNPFDKDAIAAYTTMPVFGPESQSYTWILAGYVSASQTSYVIDKTKVYEGRIRRKTNDFWDINIEHERVF